MKKFSVLLPVYNGEKFVCESINSVLSQTFTNFELLIIDDGSTDATVDLLSSYTSDERIRLIRNRTNIGLPGTLRKGVELSTGDWIARLDQDDLMHPSRLERQLSFAQSNSLDICGSWAELIDTEGVSFGELRVPCTHNEILLAMKFQNPFIHSSVIFRRDFVSRTNQNYILDREIRVEDYDLWTRFALAGARMGSIDDKFIKYRMHKDSMTSLNTPAMKHASDMIKKRYWQKVKESKNMSSVYRNLYFDVALRSPIFFLKMAAKFFLKIIKYA